MITVKYEYCFLGSTDGKIHCWNTETGAKVVILNGDHTGPVQCIQFNPKYMMLTTACSNMVCHRSSLGSRSVPWLGEGLRMPSPNYPVLCFPLPDRVAPVFV